MMLHHAAWLQDHHLGYKEFIECSYLQTEKHNMNSESDPQLINVSALASHSALALLLLQIPVRLQ